VPFTRQVDEVSQVYTVDLGEQVIQQEQAAGAAARSSPLSWLRS